MSLRSASRRVFSGFTSGTPLRRWFGAGLLALSALGLAACSGGGSDGADGGMPSGFATPTQAKGASLHRVEVMLDGPARAGNLDGTRYRIVSAEGATLVVSAVDVGTTDNRIVLTTAAQSATSYTLSVDGATSSFGFNGSLTHEPVVSGAAAVDAKRVEISFSEPLDESAIAMPSYVLAPEDAPDAPILLTSVAFGESQASIVLKTSTPLEADRDYVVTAAPSIRSVGGIYLNPLDTTAILNSSTANLKLLSAQVKSETSVLLTFSAALGATAADISHYSGTPGIFVQSAVLSEPGLLGTGTKSVLLTTGPLYDINYTVTVSGLLDRNGNPLDPTKSSAVFKGPKVLDEVRPRVVSAIASGNTAVRVNFSKPMGDNALNPAAYAIVQNNVNPEVGTIGVVSAAFVDGSRLVVELTTRSQNEVAYEVTASGMTDLEGRPLAGPEPFGVDPTRAQFAGVPPSGTELADSDGDGLTDNQESRGYSISIRLANGEIETREVTASADLADTDGDGLDDFTERTLGTDPRNIDTDADGIDDNAEYNEVYSDPANQDTDGDTLTDGLEFTFFFTSPIQADSDGDQTSDGDEVGLATRRPRVADLPQPALEIGNMDLQLDVRFVETNSSGSRELDSKTATATLTQSDERSYSNSASQTWDVAYKTWAETTIEVGYENGPTANAAFTTGFESSTSYAYATEWSESTTRSTQQAYEDSLTTEAEVTEGSTLSREISAARLAAAVTLRNPGNIAFTIRNLQVSALIQDPLDPSRLTPVATLLPVEGADSAYNLGTLNSQIGPLIFENDSVFPQLVERLMADPRGLVFRFSNYDITDELGRNFAFTSQDITDRTTALVLDFGGTDGDGDGIGDAAETHFVSTGSGRVIDTDGDGDIDGDDHRVVFDADGRQVGITLADALGAIGLKRYDEDVTASDSLSRAQRESSYSVQNIAGGQRIFRIRNARIREGDPSEWLVVMPDGIDRRLTVDDVILNAGGGGVLLALVEDLDRDNLPALLEFANGCSDQNKDTDNDGLDDRFESLIGWEVETDRGLIGRLHPSCRLADTDADGLLDIEEAPGLIEYDANGLIRIDAGHEPRRDTSTVPADSPPIDFTLADPITDPTSRDTDGDGLDDRFEISGYEHTLRTGETIFVITSPEYFDSEGDTASDGLELALGGNPRLDDAGDGFGDSDGDGLLDVQEESGWQITIEDVSERGESGICPSRGCTPGPQTVLTVTSDKLRADSDGDGLSDFDEFRLGTAPAAVAGIDDPADTDGDGLTDAEEVLGLQTEDYGIVYTDPLDGDSDNDARFDGAELGRRTAPGNGNNNRAGMVHVVTVPGEPPYQVYSDPNKVDSDLDGLVDGNEVQFGGDPNSFNTDNDHLGDLAEALRGSRVAVPDYLVTVYFADMFTPQDGDEGTGQGEWYFDLGVRRPDGSVVANRLNSGRTPELPICREVTGTDHLCREDEGDDEIKFESNRLPRLDFGPYGIEVGSVSSTTELFEQFAIVGVVRESDGSSETGCIFEYPDFTADENETTGVFDSTILRLGQVQWTSRRETRSPDGDREACEYEIRGFVEVR